MDCICWIATKVAGRPGCHQFTIIQYLFAMQSITLKCPIGMGIALLKLKED
jgi:hypothetical protein